MAKKNKIEPLKSKKTKKSDELNDEQAAQVRGGSSLPRVGWEVNVQSNALSNQISKKKS